MDEVLNILNETNPDEPEGEYKNIHEMLMKKRDNQNIKPKE